MNRETIADIVAEMRTHASGDAKSAWYTPETWRQLCDRIEAVDNRLRAALKPVMECHPRFFDDDLTRRLPMWDSTKCVEAVCAAQKIMKGDN